VTAGRSLAYLAGVEIERVQGLAGKRGANLREAGIEHVTDLLLHTPRRYIDRSLQAPLTELPLGEEVTAIGTVKKVSMRRPRRNLTVVEATVSDDTSQLFAVWFNQAFRARQLTEGAEGTPMSSTGLRSR
jgi:ATP-dependent DNA helicase RecG